MRQERHRHSDSADKTVRDIRRATRRRFSAEDKIRIVLEGLRDADLGRPCARLG
jgi:transposase